jgi:hypothetical protein
VADASKRRVYGWPASTGRSSWPIIESQTFTVPPGIWAHSRPSVTADGVFPLVHQGALTPESKLPFRIRSYGGASAAVAGTALVRGTRRKALRLIAEILRNLVMQLPPEGKCAGSAFTIGQRVSGVPVHGADASEACQD